IDGQVNFRGPVVIVPLHERSPLSIEQPRLRAGRYAEALHLQEALARKKREGKPGVRGAHQCGLVRPACTGGHEGVAIASVSTRSFRTTLQSKPLAPACLLHRLTCRLDLPITARVHHLWQWASARCNRCSFTK